LTAEQEARLVERILEGDAKAKEYLFTSLTPLVLKTAGQVYRNCRKSRVIDKDDLISEGFIGLERAVRRFDPTVGCRFFIYARYDIKYAMLKAIAINMASVTRGRGGNVLRRFLQLAAVIDREGVEREIVRKFAPGAGHGDFDERYSVLVNAAELAEILGVTPQDIAGTHAILHGDTLPLNDLVHGSEEEDIDLKLDLNTVTRLIEELKRECTPTQRVSIDHVILNRDLEKLREVCDAQGINHKSAMSCAARVRGIMHKYVSRRLTSKRLVGYRDESE